MAVPFRIRLGAVLAAATLTIVAACSDTTAPSIEKTRFAASLGVDLDASTKTPSGLYYRDVTPGAGPAAKAGDSVSVAYELYNTNGSRWDAGTALKFKITPPTEFPVVIEGFNEGVTGMQVGGRRQLIIPPHLGYGNQWDAHGRIPPNSILVFNITLNSIVPAPAE